MSLPRGLHLPILPARSFQVDIRWSKSEPLGRFGRSFGVIEALETKKPLVEEAPGLPGEETTTVSAGTVGGFDGWGRIFPNRSAPTLPPEKSPASTVFDGSADNAGIKPQVWQPTRLTGDLLETPESPTPGLERPIPAPLDLSAVAGPVTRPVRNLPDPKPVVLNSSALDNLRRLGGPSSSVSSFESRGSGVPGIVLVGRVTARGGGGDGSVSTGDASAGGKGSKGMGAGALCGEVAGTTAVAARAVGRTFQVMICSIAHDGNTVTHIDRSLVLMAWVVVDACFPHMCVTKKRTRSCRCRYWHFSRQCMIRITHHHVSPGLLTIFFVGRKNGHNPLFSFPPC